MAKKKVQVVHDFVLLKNYILKGKWMLGYLYHEGKLDIANPSYILADGDIYTRKQLQEGIAMCDLAIFLLHDQLMEFIDFSMLNELKLTNK